MLKHLALGLGSYNSRCGGCGFTLPLPRLELRKLGQITGILIIIIPIYTAVVLLELINASVRVHCGCQTAPIYFHDLLIC